MSGPAGMGFCDGLCNEPGWVSERSSSDKGEVQVLGLMKKGSKIGSIIGGPKKEASFGQKILWVWKGSIHVQSGDKNLIQARRFGGSDHLPAFSSAKVSPDLSVNPNPNFGEQGRCLIPKR